MKGPDAFCPKSGAPLSADRHYDDDGVPQRAPVADGDGPEPPAELTTGALRSRREALLARFRRTHGRHADADPALYRRASIALRRLKNAASGPREWDVIVWYALGERLAVEGFDVDWMNAHVEPVCPACAGRLKYRSLGDRLVGVCAVDCDGSHADRLAELRDVVRVLYAAAFAGKEDDAENDGQPADTVPAADDLALL